MTSEATCFASNPEGRDLRTEIVRLNKVVKALMDRAERSTNTERSDFGLFQTTIMLEDQVRQRTEKLEAALRENARITHALEESAARFHGLADQSLIGIAMIEDGRFTYGNAKLASVFGYSIEELMRIKPLDLVIESDRPIMTEAIRKRLSGEVSYVEYVFRGRRKDGVEVDIECNSSVMFMGQQPVLISLILDVTARNQTSRKVLALHDQLRQQAIRDPLTGLFNRQYLDEVFDRELRLAECNHQNVSVVLGDIDKFKAVNDTYGHLAGDEVLKRFAKSLQQAYRTSDIYCRYGGDEFLVLLPGMESSLAFERTRCLRTALETTPIQLGAETFPVTATFGIATFPQDGRSCDQLIAAADQALYLAKATGDIRVRSASDQDQ